MLSSKRQAGAMPGARTSALLGAVGLCERFKELLPRAFPKHRGAEQSPCPAPAGCWGCPFHEALPCQV